MSYSDTLETDNISDTPLLRHKPKRAEKEKEFYLKELRKQNLEIRTKRKHFW